VAFARALKAQLTEDSDLRAELEVRGLGGVVQLDRVHFALTLQLAMPAAALI